MEIQKDRKEIGLEKRDTGKYFENLFNTDPQIQEIRKALEEETNEDAIVSLVRGGGYCDILLGYIGASLAFGRVEEADTLLDKLREAITRAEKINSQIDKRNLLKEGNTRAINSTRSSEGMLRDNLGKNKPLLELNDEDLKKITREELKFFSAMNLYFSFLDEEMREGCHPNFIMGMIRGNPVRNYTYPGLIDDIESMLDDVPIEAERLFDSYRNDADKHYRGRENYDKDEADRFYQDCANFVIRVMKIYVERLAEQKGIKIKK